MRSSWPATCITINCPRDHRLDLGLGIWSSPTLERNCLSRKSWEGGFWERRLRESRTVGGEPEDVPVLVDVWMFGGQVDAAMGRCRGRTPG